MTVVVGGVDQLVVDMPGIEPVLRPGGLPVDDCAAAQLPVGVVGEAGGVGAVAVLPGVRAQPALGVTGLVCYQAFFNNVLHCTLGCRRASQPCCRQHREDCRACRDRSCATTASSLRTAGPT